MKIITNETSPQARAAVDFYKSFIKISDLYENSLKKGARLCRQCTRRNEQKAKWQAQKGT